MSEKRAVKIRFRPNIFDIIIIAAALVAGFIFLRLSNADGAGTTVLSSGTSVRAQYTLELGNLPIGTAELMQPGDKLTDVVLKRPIGTVVSVTWGPYMVTSKNLDTGHYILTEMIGRESAYIVVEIDAVDNGSDVMAGGFAIRGGANLSVSGPGYWGYGMIVDVARD